MQRVQIDLPSPPPRHRKFRLNGWMLIPILLVVAMQYRVFSQMRELHGHDEAITHVAGRIAGTLLFSLLIAWFASLISRRSKRATNYTFAITALLMGFASYSMDVTANSLGSRAMSAQLQILVSHREAVQAAQRRLNDAGGVNVALPRDSAEAAERLTLLEELRDVVRAMIAAGDDASVELSSRLNDTRIQPAQREEFVRVFEAKVYWSVQRPMFLAIERSCAAGADFLAFLRDRPDGWSVDTAKDDIVMKSPEDAEPFLRVWNTFAEAVEAAERAQREAQKAIAAQAK